MNTLVLRYIVVLATVLAVGWIYSVLAVPLIEGTAVRSQTEYDPDDTSTLHRSDRFDLASLLPEGAWEFDECIRLETDQGQLFFQTYEQLSDGRLKVEPLTIILDRQSDNEEEVSHPVVLRTQEGAVLRFSEAFAFGQSTTGQLESTWFQGTVVITRRASGDGDDGIFIQTSNVSVEKKQITAPGDVEFQFGPHFGRGRQLTLDFVPMSIDGERDRAIGPHGDLGTLEIVQLDHLILIPPPSVRNRMRGTDDSLPIPNQLESRPDRIVVQCAGPFRFDFQSLEASFNQNVEVAHTVRSSGLVDRLNCDVLKAKFASRVVEVDDARSESSSARESNSAQQSAMDRMKDLEIESLEAIGQPAVLVIPNHHGRAEAETMVYEPATGRIYVKDDQGVHVMHEDYRIHAYELEYFLTEDGRLGEAVSLGPGRIERLPTADDPAFVASWSEELRIRPDGGIKALSLYGSTHLELGPEDSFDAHDLHLWLDEIPEEVAPDTTDPEDRKWRMVPVKILATGPQQDPGDGQNGPPIRAVRFDSPRLTGAVERLEVFFAASLANRPSSQGQSRSDDRGGAGSSLLDPIQNPSHRLDDGQRNPYEDERRQKLFCGGDLMRIRLTPTGDEYQIDELTLGGDVSIREIETKNEDELPLDLSGSILQATSRGADFFYIVVQGTQEELAHVSARGLSIVAEQINVDQLANQVWVEGAGEATVASSESILDLLDRTHPEFSEARRRVNRPMIVSWRDRMVFDGEAVQIEGGVIASGTRWNEKGERSDWAAQSEILLLVLDRHINLADTDSDQSEESAEVASIELDRNVVLQTETFDPIGVQSARELLRVPNFAMNQLTGEIQSLGAGTAVTTRRGGQEILQDPLNNATTQNESDQEDEDGLTYLNIRFSTGIVGNSLRREVHFVGDVDAIVGPVFDWDQELDRRTPLHDPNVEQARMMCDRLAVAQWGEDDNGQPLVEIQGIGNAFIAGRGFEATGAKVAFNQLQNMLILEGDQHAYAKLLQKAHGAGTGDFAEARKIIYWRHRDRIEFDGGRTINASYTGNLTPPRRMDNQ